MKSMVIDIETGEVLFEGDHKEIIKFIEENGFFYTKHFDDHDVYVATHR